MTIDFEADALVLTTGNDSLSSVSELARQAKEIQQHMEDLEITLAEKREALKDILENRIPDALHEIGMKGFDMKDGSSVEIKQYYSASIPADRKGEAYEWLRSNGYDDIIKNIVSVQFGRGEDEEAGKLINVVREQGLIPDQSEKIEPMTLKAFVREMTEKGVALPQDLFNPYVGWKAVIKTAK